LLRLSWLRHTEIFEHVLQLRQEFARLIARPVPRELPRPVDHALKITTGENPRRIDALLGLLRVARQIFGESLQIAVERLL